MMQLVCKILADREQLFMKFAFLEGFSSGVIGAMTLLGNVSGATVGVFFTVSSFFHFLLDRSMLCNCTKSTTTFCLNL